LEVGQLYIVRCACWLVLSFCFGMRVRVFLAWDVAWVSLLMASSYFAGQFSDPVGLLNCSTPRHIWASYIAGRCQRVGCAASAAWMDYDSQRSACRARYHHVHQAIAGRQLDNVRGRCSSPEYGILQRAPGTTTTSGNQHGQGTDLQTTTRA
jgi:hypothetical protein